jgi:two-component system, response regulator PdtaR
MAMEQKRQHRVVVLVEDESLIRTIVASALEDAAFEVIEVASADEAAGILEQRHDVHVVFTDVTLPGSMDGFDLAHHVRRRWPGIAILVTSARPRPARRLPDGCHFIPKPYDIDDVIRHAH